MNVLDFLSRMMRSFENELSFGQDSTSKTNRYELGHRKIIAD